MNKVLLIDKPAGWTSFDVVARIRASIKYDVLGIKHEEKKIRVGHAGTLDPFATGLLIVLVGNETKKQDSYMKQDKEYVATLKLGFTSTTGDPEGEITSFRHSELSDESRITGLGSFVPTQDDVEIVLERFLGEISQTPPIYSAIKVNGKRAYKQASEGKVPEMKPRQVTIYELEILNYEFPNLEIRVKCSSGTYIRTLAEDIGKALCTGAYLTSLRRTKIGEFNVEDSLTVDEAISLLPPENHQSPEDQLSTR
jgi:tRNA pseudouridine55 synthase